MKYFNNKILASLLAVGLFVVSCKKVETPDPIGDAGQVIVRLVDGGDAPDYGHRLLGVDFVTTPQTINFVQIYRDVPENASLNTSMTVIVKDDTAALTAYNLANGTNILPLPRSWYTSNFPASSMGGQYTVKFAPGDFSQFIKITIPNSTLLNPSNTYALAFTLVSNDANAKNSSGKTYVFEIGAKNIYDGVYDDEFTNYHPTSNPGYTGDVTEVHLVTTAANKVKIFWPLAGAFGNPAVLGGSLSYFGAQEPEITVNTATNAATIQNAFAGATTFYTMGAGFNSRYEPATKTFYIKYGYSYAVPGVFDAACREWTMKLKYTGPR